MAAITNLLIFLIVVLTLAIAVVGTIQFIAGKRTLTHYLALAAGILFAISIVVVLVELLFFTVNIRAG